MKIIFYSADTRENTGLKTNFSQLYSPNFLKKIFITTSYISTHDFIVAQDQ